ncbi:MAG: glycosyltransferase family 2 protein [Kiritimatiellae bacterium]|nr:glycosyltransferase family 2 protein [Kiritimatiellia bacterium]
MNSAPRHDQKACVVIPAYREQRMIRDVVQRVRKYVQPVIVVDDGSTDRTADEAADADAVVIRHTVNMGKGVALNTGFNYARQNRFDYLITLDADGQHDPADIPRFIEAYERTGIPVLIGNRMGALSNMPQIRKWTNRYMSWLLSRAMNQYVPDTQCGFRLYRCDVLPFIEAQATRFAAESEILLHIASRGIRMDSVPITVIYNEEKSKINPLRDTFRFFLMLSRYYQGRKRARRRE